MDRKDPEQTDKQTDSPRTSHENINSSSNNQVQDVEKQPPPGPPPIEYPPVYKVIPIMAAVYLVFFLVSLVRIPWIRLQEDH